MRTLMYGTGPTIDPTECADANVLDTRETGLRHHLARAVLDRWHGSLLI